MISDPRLDLRGLKCPLPALMARRALLRAEAGTEIEVICDDPLCALDLPHMARQEGFAILHERRESGTFTIVLRR